MRVINVRDWELHPDPIPHYVYAARPSVFGNPHTTHMSCPVARCNGIQHSKEGAIQAYREDLVRNASLLEKVALLHPDTVLGCFCKPDPCHCDVIVEVHTSLLQMIEANPSKYIKMLDAIDGRTLRQEWEALLIKRNP